MKIAYYLLISFFLAPIWLVIFGFVKGLIWALGVPRELEPEGATFVMRPDLSLEENYERVETYLAEHFGYYEFIDRRMFERDFERKYEEAVVQDYEKQLDNLDSEF